MSESPQVNEPRLTPFSERVVTDYSTLPPEYVEYLQRKMDEAERREAKAKQAS